MTSVKSKWLSRKLWPCTIGLKPCDSAAPRLPYGRCGAQFEAWRRVSTIRVKSADIAPMTLVQSPGLGCRYNRAVGYQGVSLRSNSHRQSAAYLSAIHVGRASAPARCAVDVSHV